MTRRPADSALPVDLRSLGEALLESIDCPAALIVDGQSVVALNADWQRTTGCRPSTAGSLTLGEALGEFRGIEALATPLQTRSASVGSTTLVGAPKRASSDHPSRGECVARWRQVQSSIFGHSYAIVCLETSEVEELESVIDSQRVRINHLLVRQTLIEERERRRLGRALHDGVSQQLACIRRKLVTIQDSKEEVSPLVVELDRAIEGLRDLAFELSPPILEDLGLVPALHWLASDLSRRYGVRMEVVENPGEPRLSHAVRTIVFRAMRELATNAAKHAFGADITLFSEACEGTARLSVRDQGPGFDVTAVGDSASRTRRFGLISVEQQIQAIGGTLEIVSSREGTQATVTIACDGDGGGHE